MLPPPLISAEFLVLLNQARVSTTGYPVNTSQYKITWTSSHELISSMSILARDTKMKTANPKLGES